MADVLIVDGLLRHKQKTTKAYILVILSYHFSLQKHCIERGLNVIRPMITPNISFTKGSQYLFRFAVALMARETTDEAQRRVLLVSRHSETGLVSEYP